MAATNLTIRNNPPNGAGILDLAAIEQALDNTDGAKYQNDGRTRLLIRNAGAGSHVLTFVTPGTSPGGNAIANKTFTVGAGDWAEIPPLSPDEYNEQSGANAGYTTFTSDGTQSEVKAVAVR